MFSNHRMHVLTSCQPNIKISCCTDVKIADCTIFGKVSNDYMSKKSLTKKFSYYEKHLYLDFKMIIKIN